MRGVKMMKPRLLIGAMAMALGATVWAQPFPSFQLDTARVVGRDLKVGGDISLAASETRGMVIWDSGFLRAIRLNRSMEVVDTIPLNITDLFGSYPAPAVACSDSGYGVVWNSGGLWLTLVSSDGDVAHRVLVDSGVQIMSMSIAAHSDRYAVVYDVWVSSSERLEIRAAEVGLDGEVLRRSVVISCDRWSYNIADPQVARGDSAYLVAFEGPYSAPESCHINAKFVWPEHHSPDTTLIPIQRGARALMPQVAFDGEYFWVAWLEETTPYAETMAKLARVTQRGVLLDTGGIFVGSGVTSVALAAANDTALVALHLDGNVIVGMRYDAEAQLLDSMPLLMTIHGGRGPLAAVSADTFLVVWFEIVEGVTKGKVRLAGRRITASGKVIDQGVRDYAFSANNHWTKRAAIASDGEDFLAVWCDERAEPDYSARLVGRRFDNQGRFLDAEPFTITDHHLNPVGPVLSYGAGCYFLCWTEIIVEEPDIESTFATRISREGELMDTIPIRVSDTSCALGVAFLRDSMFVVRVAPSPANVGPYVIRVMADGRVIDSVPRMLKVKQDPDFVYCSSSISSIGDTLVMACCMLGQGLYWDALGLYDPELKQYDSVYWRPPPGTDWAKGTKVAYGGGRILMATTQRPLNNALFYLLDSVGNVLNDSLPLPDLGTNTDDYCMTWDGTNFLCAYRNGMSAKGFRVSRDGDALDPWPYVSLVEFETAFVAGKCDIAVDTMGHVGFAFFTFEPEGYMSTRARVSVFPRLTGGVEEAMNDERVVRNAGPSVVRGVLFLPPSLFSSDCLLLSVDGRKVLDLHPGANDVRALAPGVYFLRDEPQASSFKPQAVRKVVVTR